MSFEVGLLRKLLVTMVAAMRFLVKVDGVGVSFAVPRLRKMLVAMVAGVGSFVEGDTLVVNGVDSWRQKMCVRLVALVVWIGAVLMDQSCKL